MMRRGVRGQADVAAQATLSGTKLCVLVWHYHDDDVAGEPAEVSVSLNGLPQQFSGGRLTRYVIDQEHCNSYTAWQRMGSPPQPTLEQSARLEKAGQLTPLTSAAGMLSAEHGVGIVKFPLPRQAVSLLVIEPRVQ